MDYSASEASQRDDRIDTSIEKSELQADDGGVEDGEDAAHESVSGDEEVTPRGSSVDLVKDSSCAIPEMSNTIDNKSLSNAPDLLVDIPSETTSTNSDIHEDVDKTPCEAEDKKYSNIGQLSKQKSSSSDSLTQKARVENYDSSPYDDSSDSPYVCSSSEEYDSPIHRKLPLSELEIRKRSKDDTDLPSSRPDSLSLPRPLQFYEKGGIDTDKPVFQRVKEDPLKAVTTETTPQGTITREGDLVEFVAVDLQKKIKMSSPQSSQENSHRSRTSSMRTSSSLNSISSMSASWSSSATGMSRSSSFQQQSPDAIPPIDPKAVHDLELQACRVGDNLDLMMGNLRTGLQKMSSLSVDCIDVYRTSVDRTCDSVDSSIKAMYTLMAKCEELSHSMEPIYALAEQIKEIKRLLDLFESQLVQS